MSKQKEIGKGMGEFILEIRQYLCNTEFAPEPFTKPVDIDVLRKMGIDQLKKMDAQGVVILEDRVQKFSEKTGQSIEPVPYKILTSLIEGGP